MVNLLCNYIFFNPFTGNALLRRLVKVGVLDESKMKLDFVLGLRVEDFLERRLQTQVFKLGLAKSIHHARVLIRQRHIRWDKVLVLKYLQKSPTRRLKSKLDWSPNVNYETFWINCSYMILIKTELLQLCIFEILSDSWFQICNNFKKKSSQMYGILFKYQDRNVEHYK